MGRRDFFEREKKKKMITTFCMAVGLAVVVFVTVFVMYTKRLNDEAEQNLLALTEEENSNLVSNEDLQEASYSSDKTVQNSNVMMNNNTIEVEIEKPVNIATNTAVVKEPENKTPVSSVVKEEQEESEQKTEEEKPEEEAEPTRELAFRSTNCWRNH